MIYFTSDFSVLSVISGVSGRVSLSVVDDVSGDVVFENCYHSAGESLPVLGFDRILEADMRMRGSFFRNYTVSVSRDDGEQVSVSVPYGPSPGASLSAGFVHCSLKMDVQAWRFLRESFLLDQKQFTVLEPEPPLSDMPVSLASVPLTVFAEEGAQDRFRRITSFFDGSCPVTDSVFISPGWHSDSLAASASPFRLVSAGPDPLASDDAVRVSTLRVSSLSGFVLFRFRNSFNIMEPMLLRGVLSVAPEAEADSAFIGRSLRRFGVVRKESFTFSVDGLTAERALEVSRLLYAPEVSVFAPAAAVIPEARGAAVPVVVDSVEGDISEEPDSLNKVKVTFRLSVS